jgi:predicted amidohydrolase
MTLTGFSMNRDATTLTPEDHGVFTQLSETSGAAVIYGGVEDGCNRLFLAESHGHQTLYSKRHLFTYGGEGAIYEAGDSSPVVEIQGVRFGLAICYDLRFAYQFWGNAKKVDAYLVIANWPSTRREHWTALLRARAIENQAYMVGVNRVGSDPNLIYAGDSAVFGPLGERILECGPGSGAYPAELNPARTTEVRGMFRFLEDRQL